MNLRSSYENLSPQEQRQWAWLRLFLPHRVRWYFEGCRSIPGQLWRAERKLLYETIRKVKPSTVVEVGTWHGGGSTYFISQALHDNGFGMLHTIEINPDAHQTAKDNYRRHLPHLLGHVHFHLGKATDIYPPLLRELKNIDTVFLDGSASPNEARDEFEMFKPFLRRGAVVLMHDWDNEKMTLLRPYIEQSSEWKVQQTITAPHSVGFAVVERVQVMANKPDPCQLHALQ
jgi:predicted O-methyltransferase YrrM